MNQYSKQNIENKTKKNLIVLHIGFYLFYSLEGLVFDWTSITVQDYRIGALFYNLRTPCEPLL